MYDRAAAISVDALRTMALRPQQQARQRAKREQEDRECTVGEQRRQLSGMDLVDCLQVKYAMAHLCDHALKTNDILVFSRTSIVTSRIEVNPSDPTVGFDDLVTADGPVSDFHQAPAPTNVFRVMSLDVKRRRVGTELVVEHSKAIGVVPLCVVLKDNENRQLFVESQCADQDLSAHSIAMEHLVRMGTVCIG